MTDTTSWILTRLDQFAMLIHVVKNPQGKSDQTIEPQIRTIMDGIYLVMFNMKHGHHL